MINFVFVFISVVAPKKRVSNLELEAVVSCLMLGTEQKISLVKGYNFNI